VAFLNNNEYPLIPFCNKVLAYFKKECKFANTNKLWNATKRFLEGYCINVMLCSAKTVR